MTIVIVETDDAQRQELLQLCAQAGCTAVGVCEGAAALDYLQQAAEQVWVILLALRIALARDAICATIQRDPLLAVFRL